MYDPFDTRQALGEGDLEKSAMWHFWWKSGLFEEYVEKGVHRFEALLWAEAHINNLPANKPFDWDEHDLEWEDGA